MSIILPVSKTPAVEELHGFIEESVLQPPDEAHGMGQMQVTWAEGGHERGEVDVAGHLVHVARYVVGENDYAGHLWERTEGQVGLGLIFVYKHIPLAVQGQDTFYQLIGSN